MDATSAKALRKYFVNGGQAHYVHNRGGIDVSTFRVQPEDVEVFEVLADVEYVDVWQHGIELIRNGGDRTEINL